MEAYEAYHTTKTRTKKNVILCRLAKYASTKLKREPNNMIQVLLPLAFACSSLSREKATSFTQYKPGQRGQ